MKKKQKDVAKTLTGPTISIRRPSARRPAWGLERAAQAVRVVVEHGYSTAAGWDGVSTFSPMNARRHGVSLIPGLRTVGGTHAKDFSTAHAQSASDRTSAHLDAILHDQAARDHRDRGDAAAFAIAFGVGAIGGSLPFYVVSPQSPTERTLFLATGIGLDALGALSLGSGIATLFVPTVTERLAFDYDAVRRDPNPTETERVAWGEDHLSALARGGTAAAQGRGDGGALRLHRVLICR